MFGIELRRSSSVKTLLKGVDQVLTDNNMHNGAVSDNAKVMAVAHALHKMLSAESYFSVCAINDCKEICQVCISSERMAIYKSAHCMNYNEMDVKYRELLVAMVLDDFRSVLELI